MSTPTLSLETSSHQIEAIHLLAHELRQPLSAMESIAYYLRMTMGENREPADKLSALIAQANWILNDAVSCMQAAPLVREWVDVNELIAATLFEDTPVDLEDALPPVYADPVKLTHMLQSLVLFFRQSKPALRSRLAAGCVEVQGAIAVKREPPCATDPFTPLASARRIAEAHGGRFQTSYTEGLYTVRVTLPAGR